MNAVENSASAREIILEGTRNFRDLGGIATPAGRTRFGVLFRSDRLSNLTEADAQKLRELRVRTVVDLRSDEERHRAPNRLPADFPAAQLVRAFLPRHTQTLFDGVNDGSFDATRAFEMMCLQYDALVLDHIADYRRILDDLLLPDALPLVFHCTSGKDRTGILAAILLLALGAHPDAVAEDYVMTEGRIERVDFFGDHVHAEVMDIVMAAKVEYLEAAYAAMCREFGSVEAYLTRGLGIAPAERDRLAAMLIE